MADAELDIEEQKLVDAFLSGVNTIHEQGGQSPVDAAIAIRFLMARKFDVPRAVQLFHNYTNVVEQYNLKDQTIGAVVEQLATGTVVIPGTRDKSGALLIFFFAKQHQSKSSRPVTVLRALYFLLNDAIQSVQTMRHGITLVYSMEGSSWANVDLKLLEMTSKLLQDAFPARVHRVLVYRSPWWAQLALGVMRPFVKEKLYGKIETVASLEDRLDMACVPEVLGGTLAYDHTAWLQGLVAGTDVVLPPVATLERTQKKKETAKKETKSSAAATNETAPMETDSVEADAEAPAAQAQTAAVAPVDALQLSKYISFLSRKVNTGEAEEEFNRTDRSPGNPSFEAAKDPYNKKKNRYSNILALEATRVHLQGCAAQDDYINANYVDGYARTQAYICTQGPLEHTVGDFWSMTWQQNSRVIFMITNLMVSQRPKCHMYWPERGAVVECDGLTVVSQAETLFDEYAIREFKMTHNASGEERIVTHYQYHGWPDHGVPDSTDIALRLLALVNADQTRFERAPSGAGPVIVHCSAGIGRTGTIVAIDIAAKELKATGHLPNMQRLMHDMRLQRSRLIETAPQFEFCHQALADIAMAICNGEA